MHMGGLPASEKRTLPEGLSGQPGQAVMTTAACEEAGLGWQQLNRGHCGRQTSCARVLPRGWSCRAPAESRPWPAGPCLCWQGGLGPQVSLSTCPAFCLHGLSCICAFTGVPGQGLLLSGSLLSPLSCTWLLAPRGFSEDPRGLTRARPARARHAGVGVGWRVPWGTGSLAGVPQPGAEEEGPRGPVLGLEVSGGLQLPVTPMPWDGNLPASLGGAYSPRPHPALSRRVLRAARAGWERRGRSLKAGAPSHSPGEVVLASSRSHLAHCPSPD